MGHDEEKQVLVVAQSCKYTCTCRGSWSSQMCLWGGNMIKASTTTIDGEEKFS